MTISSESIKAGPFSGNDSTTAFAFTFKCFAQGDLKVVLTNSSGVDTTLTITTDYTVSLNANQDTSPGGSITTTGSSSPPATGEKLTILNEPAYTQGTDLITGGGFYPDVVETALDRSTVLARRAKEQVGRSVQIPVSDSAGTTVELPTNTLRANKALVFDADGDVGVSVDDFDDQAAAAATSAAAAAVSATSAASSASAVAIPFLMDTGSTTMSDPAGTNFRLNNATVSSVSLIAFGDTSEDGVDVTDYLMTWDDSTSTINGHLILVQEGTPANWAVFAVGAMTDNTDWVQCAVTHVDSGGSLFTNDVTVRCQFIRAGDKGDTGSTGAVGATGSGEGLEMTFESTQTDTDQGAGKVWLNGSAAAATIVYMDDVDANAANINSFVDSWDDSTSTSIKGRITIKKQVAPENYIIYTFAGAVTSASTYSKLTSCVHVASAGTIADTDAVFVTFSRVGDKGDTGSTGAQGASVGTALLWDSDTSDADSGNGKIFGNHGTVASISQLYIDDLDSAGTNIEAWIATMDDSTTTAVRGTITIVKTTAQAQMAVFTVTSAVVDGTGYWKIPCTHVMSNVGSLADGDAVTVTFTRSGNIGATGATGGVGVEMPDNTFRIQDNSDATKEIAFEASGISTGTTRTLTVPDANVTLGTPNNNTVDETKLKDALVADFTEVTVATGDSLIFGDATDSGNTKRDTVQGVIDLVHGATAGVQTIWVPAIAMVSPTTNGAEAAAVETTATRPEMKVLDFDSSTIEYAQFSIAMPKSWNLGTVTAKFYWTHATAVATDVIWGIQGVVVSDNDTIDIAYGTAVTVTDTFHNAAEDLAVSDSTAAITLAGTPADDDLAYFQVYRAATTAGDTTNSTDARLLGVKIFFTTDAENDD